MERYRLYGQTDDQPKVVGDEHFLGVDEYNNPENVQPGNVQKAVNLAFNTLNAETRGGFVCLPELGLSPFGHKWDYYTIGGTTATYNDVSYGNGLFVAVGSTAAPASAISTSPDGITWTSRTPATAVASFLDIAFANGVFVAVGTSATNPVNWSTDGITWTASVTPPTTGFSWRGVAYGNGKWVAVASGRYAISTDNGKNWTTTTGVTELALASGLSFGNGIFTAVSSGFGRIITSTDGITWTIALETVSDIFLDVAFGNQRFVALAALGATYTSIDGVTWTQTRSATPLTNWTTLTYGNGMFMAFATTGTTPNAIYSIAGDVWNTMSGVPAYNWRGSTFGNNKIVVVGDSSASMVSDSAAISVFASSIYSDPNSPDTIYLMLLGSQSVGFYSSGHSTRTVSLGSYTVNQQSTIVQANNQVFIFRGDDQKPLYWAGDWNASFVEVPDTALPASFNSIPNSNQATYYQNRLWVRSGKDSVAASDVLAFTDYDPLANEFSLNTGNSDFVVATFPFGQNSLICFKNKSIELMQNVEGSLSDVTTTEITRQVGLVGINAVTSIGPDLAYVSYGNINLLTLTSTNNSLQHKTLPLSSRIRKIMQRVNWDVAEKISVGYWSNKLYVALPLDNSQFCNAVVVYNFITESWYGEWNFNPSINMCIQGWAVVDYLGLQRLHAVTEDGRIFVTEEGQNDISGAVVAEISTEMVTRAYHTEGNSNSFSVNHFQRRMFADLATNRPKFSAAAYTEGANEETVLITDQTYSRSQSWKFNDSSYDLTNANDDYNRAYRKDYATGPASVQCGTGFQPEMTQDLRLPILTNRAGRLSWLQITNTQGYMMVKSIGLENRLGQRGSAVQV